MEFSENTSYSRNKKINDFKYILIFNYFVKFIFSFLLGWVLYSLFDDQIPSELNGYVTSLFLPHENLSETINFIYEIIANSVDIFKISFIIMLSGITYISSIISNLCISVAGIFYGLSTRICIADIVTRTASPDNIFEITVLILKMFMLSLLVIYCCVMSIRSCNAMSRFNSPSLLIRSENFWGYLLRIFITFGYVIILEVLFRFVFKFFN